MILGVDPEHGDHGDAVLARHLLRQLHRRQRFQKREQRSAEETGLLAGDDDDGLGIGEACSGFTCRRRGAAALLLGRDNARQLRRGADVRLAPLNRIGPGIGTCGIAREVRRDLLEAERVVGGEPSNPWESPDIDSQRRHAGRLCGLEVVYLSQVVSEPVKASRPLDAGRKTRRPATRSRIHSSIRGRASLERWCRNAPGGTVADGYRYCQATRGGRARMV